MPRYYPIYLDIRDKKCVVVGGGDVAYRKAVSLKEAGAQVVVISPDFSKDFLKEEKERTYKSCNRRKLTCLLC